MARYPTRFLWTAPTKNVDGTPLTYALDYEFEARLQGSTGAFASIYVTPGTLNPDGRYTAPLADMPYFELGKSYEVGLVAIDKLNPTNRSVRSNVVSFTVSDGTPQRPLDFTIE